MRLYVFSDGANLFKIGVSNTVERRLRAVSNKADVGLKEVFSSDDFSDSVARAMEAICHSHFIDKRVEGEWFSNLTDCDIDKIRMIVEENSKDIRVFGMRVFTVDGLALTTVREANGQSFPTPPNTINSVAFAEFSKPNVYSVVLNKGFAGICFIDIRSAIFIREKVSLEARFAIWDLLMKDNKSKDICEMLGMNDVTRMEGVASAPLKALK